MLHNSNVGVSGVFYERFIELCEKKGVSRSAACQAVGLSSNAWRRWIGGSTPNGKSLKAIAEFFGVQPKDMLYGEQPRSADVRQDVFDRPEMRILFDAAKDAPSSAILEAALSLMKLKESNPD